MRGGRLREVSPTETARCRRIVLEAIGVRSRAIGWPGAATNVNSTRPMTLVAKPPEGAAPDAPIARSTRFEASASQLPPSTSLRKAQAGARGLRVELLHHVGEAVEVEKGVQRYAELGLPSPGDLLYAAFEVDCGLQEPAPFVEQLPAGFGELGPVAPAVEQEDVQAVLELLDGVSDR